MPESTPLWAAEDQRERLAELTAATAEPRKEAPLRRDVRSLGTLLGETLVEQQGRELFEVVETLRRTLIDHREQSATFIGAKGTSPLLERAKGMVAGLDVASAYRVSKAFAAYFDLTNLAETHHRKRRRRAALFHPAQPPLAGSVRATLVRLRGPGVTAEQALEALKN